MGLTMDKLLDKFNDCNIFSLTGKSLGYKMCEDEFLNALMKMEIRNKEQRRIMYEDIKKCFINYPEFDRLYDEIKKECYDFCSEENKNKYLNIYFNDKKIKLFKKNGINEEQINTMKKDFFCCSLIVDYVGKTTKYGKENLGFFWNLYHDIAMNIDCENKKDKYCFNGGKSLLEQIPEELKEYFLYYEVSFYNFVTISGVPMINYYFKLNDETKKYLLQFENDFCMKNLEDLTLYKDDDIKFYSCTHERFNSLGFVEE